MTMIGEIINQFHSHVPTHCNDFNVNTARFLKYVWSFFNIMKESVNGNIDTKWVDGTDNF